MADESEGSLIVVVVDVNPVWWGLQDVKNDKGLTLFECLDHIMTFVNSHLMMNYKNRIAVIASHTNESRFLYPVQESPATAEDTEGARHVADGKYEHFAKVNDAMQDELRQLLFRNPTVVHTDTLLAGSLATGLCYIHRIQKECAAGQQIKSRLLVIKAADDSASQYMNFMNVIFTAQKQSIPIDACILEKDSGLLQQACDITGGMYLKIPQISGLLQYLLWVFLPDPSLRDTLTLPPAIHVDYRAACFCHRTLIDIGYVCSVCLSIFCTYSPICSTCHTAFKLKTAPVLKAKKKKKSALQTS
ncbi:general transcription factor IIH subunit 3-like isoform X1 [Patiria miniata]|uniref:General transcription factor IIH subunit 3 n=2 Tax=Patiria miniata TaxID=46514 RepID=A0A914AEQ0_PATMI|nr:general transcription factor IIH subunit 3-like isoform X1 [Patiria miniata]XP_038061832.1 general transcription factor IIH subunit 3-like isoform X1 [Patiria miniata]XP_038061834.1 general transcription factor IIH subunit 3-like isoform X1 [Patiria miniata]